MTWKRVLDDVPEVETVVGDYLDNSSRRQDYREVIATPGVDAAIIALPVGLHLEAIKVAIGRKIPVLCEKPLVSNRGELHDLLTVLGRTDVVVRVAQNYRLRSWVAATRTAVQELGAIRHVRIVFAQPEFMGGGRGELEHPLLNDMVVHHIDLLRHLTGAEATVLGAWSARPEPTRYSGETDLDAVLRLSEGALVSYSGTWAARGAPTPWDGDWEIRCDEGAVLVRGLQVVVEKLMGGIERRDHAPPDNEHADLEAVWSEFNAAIEGDTGAGVTVPDNARTVSLVFDLGDLALGRSLGFSGKGRNHEG
jgi:predicted dehydrogenase